MNELILLSRMGFLYWKGEMKLRACKVRITQRLLLHLLKLENDNDMVIFNSTVDHLGIVTFYLLGGNLPDVQEGAVIPEALIKCDGDKSTLEILNNGT